MTKNNKTSNKNDSQMCNKKENKTSAKKNNQMTDKVQTNKCD